MLRAVRRAKIDKFIDVVLHAGLAQHRVGDEGGAHAANGKTVGLGDFVHMIGGLPAAAGGHVLHNDRRIAGHMFAQDVDDRARAHIRRAGGRPAENDVDRFVGEKRRLR